jgi:hypothetical protein
VRFFCSAYDERLDDSSYPEIVATVLLLASIGVHDLYSYDQFCASGIDDWHKNIIRPMVRLSRLQQNSGVAPRMIGDLIAKQSNVFRIKAPEMNRYAAAFTEIDRFAADISDCHVEAHRLALANLGKPRFDFRANGAGPQRLGSRRIARAAGAQ